MFDLLQHFIDLGAIVVLPILIFIFGMLFGTPARKVFNADLTVGIGFVGLNLVVELLSGSLGKAAQAMVERFGLQLTTLDVGWPAAAAISYGTLLGSLAIPIEIAINIFLLFIGWTKTLMVDMWNFWHAAFVASLVYAVTQHFALGLYAMLAYQVMIYLLADIIAPAIKKFYGFPNITFPHGTSAPGFLVAIPLNWIFDRIPGFNKIEADPESIQKKFGIFGESTVMGLIIGIVIGILAGYDVQGILQLGVKTAAVMLLMPRMVSILMEGLAPISGAANSFVQKHFPGREVNIGMDSALSVGHPAVLSSSLLLVPITILLAVILPGNTNLPFGDLATIPFVVCLMAAVFRGNIVRTVIGGAIYMVSILYLTSWAAPLVTASAKAAEFNLDGHSSITAMAEGGLWPTGLFVFAANHLPWLVITLILVVSLAGLFYVNKGSNSKSEVIK
ncbi:Galactitol permease IIC component [Streptococcus dysgalactiae subsp. equisimilis]|uniref:PTS transporter subunit IIC n=1 Tax=Streptococcus dysgalactiae subsp. equisimilis TaxID=119602 RepID=A0AB38Y1Y5_STREQ|nr:PTS transporter subunit IIC [Streptococcus dysgalactiae]KKC16312.1 PTS galactitol transporter subunit IIC [Streptococcus dysgalactiae subsp. equisimilis]MBM6541361.1 PTS galactitol transporter subunit IIC [Streptococcus dysgalactiae subsp. equisimilis]QQY18205.1 PTS galactitol transporter subunit IIC [Streptococcus dysgalactiae]TYK96307.1 PTS galactitol transporter subunit IIC [Streptococcus dysgalactiae]TYL01521.1 PTS galactitol transporter subunit IIC [Streptococcus dysgalactiae]